MTVGIFVASILLLIYSSWFTFSGTFSSGDWPYLFKENIQEFSFFSKDWILWLTPYYETTAKIFVDYLNFPWELAERIFWFWPLLILLVFSSYYFTRSAIGVLLYSANTYILMVVGGGQLGIAMGYALAPLVLARWIRDEPFNKKHILFTGLIFALQMMFDPRIAYVTFVAVFFRSLFFLKTINFKSVGRLVTPLIIAVILNSWWVIKAKQGIPQGFEHFESTEGFKFFSFSDFSHTLSFLHPNWPENIFGKIYFLKPEFLILPIIAYSSLLFTGKIKVERNILFFAFLGLLGVFLAKGTNPPFGEVNILLFEYLPGMQMFRDPTKFYLLIALSYSILIPHSLSRLQLWINLKLPLVFLLFIAYYLLLIRPAVLGELSGTFRPHPVPQEYIKLKDFLYDQPDSFSTLWLPAIQRYGYSSRKHPAMSEKEFSESLDHSFLEKSGIKYIIVSYDSQKELFITDRSYDEEKRRVIVEQLRSITWLSPLQGFDKIVIFEITK